MWAQKTIPANVKGESHTPAYSLGSKVSVGMLIIGVGLVWEFCRAKKREWSWTGRDKWVRGGSNSDKHKQSKVSTLFCISIVEKHAVFVGVGLVWEFCRAKKREWSWTGPDKWERGGSNSDKHKQSKVSTLFCISIVENPELCFLLSCLWDDGLTANGMLNVNWVHCFFGLFSP